MKSQTNFGGYWMLLGLVALLAAPMAIGYLALPKASAEPVIQASIAE